MGSWPIGPTGPDAIDPGFVPGSRLDLVAAHPIGSIYFENCLVPAGNRIGDFAVRLKGGMYHLEIIRQIRRQQFFDQSGNRRSDRPPRPVRAARRRTRPAAMARSRRRHRAVPPGP